MWGTWFAQLALATPSAICPGWCEDGLTACGGPEDCGGGEVCTFEDVCLPGGAFAVERVVPGSEALLGDFSTWDFMYSGAMIDGAELVVGSSLPYIDWPAESADLPVEPGKRYFLRVDQSVDPDALGRPVVLAYSTTNPLQSVEISGAQRVHGPWGVSGVVFSVGADTAVRARLYGANAGEGTDAVRFRDLALLELRDEYSLYLRAKLDDPLADVQMDPASAPLLFGGATYYGPDLPPVLVPAGQWSDWLDLGAAFPASSFTLGLTFEGGGPVQGTLQFAWAPREDALVDALQFADPTGAVGFWAPGGPPDPSHLADRIQPLSEVMAADLLQLAPVPTAPPALTGATTSFGWGPDYGDWSLTHPTVELLGAVGLNGVYQQDFPADEVTALQAAGLTWRTTLMGPPGAYLGPSVPYTLGGFEGEMAAYYASYPATSEAMAELGGSRDHLLIDMVDEAYGLMFVGPEYDQAFRDWLQTEICPVHHPGEPCGPELFGAADWADIVALSGLGGTGMHVSAVDCLRPHPPEDPRPALCPNPETPFTPESAALFSWQMKWWSTSSAQLFQRTRAWLEDEAANTTPGDLPRISPQFGGPNAEYMTWRMGTELQTMYREGAGNAFYGETFVGWNDSCLGQQFSAQADWLDGQLDPWGIDQRAVHVHPNRGSGPNKVFALVARGLDWISWYTYGPFQLTTGDGTGGLGPSSADELEEIGEANAALAAAESLLADAEVLSSGIAIVAAQTDPLWHDAEDEGYTLRTQALSADELGTHLALTHGHYPVRFLVEERLPQDLGPDTQLLYLHRKYVSNDAFAAIQGWVAAGGTLVLSGELPTHDEFAQLQPDRLAWFGLPAEPEPLEPRAYAYSVWWPGIGMLPAAGAHRSLDPSAGVVLATYEDGSAAAVDRAQGSGSVRMIGFELGVAYTERDPVCLTGRLPMSLASYTDGYDPVLRNALLLPASTLSWPLTADEPLLEVIPIRSPAGDALVLLNYTGAPLVQTPVYAPTDLQALLAGVALPAGPGGQHLVDVDEVEVLIAQQPLPIDSPASPPAPQPSPPRSCSCSATPGAPWLALIGVLTLLRRRAR
jgi:MYXO-CTERM domain-containing protein